MLKASNACYYRKSHDSRIKSPILGEGTWVEENACHGCRNHKPVQTHNYIVQGNRLREPKKEGERIRNAETIHLEIPKSPSPPSPPTIVIIPTQQTPDQLLDMIDHRILPTMWYWSALLIKPLWQIDRVI
jgi:hypothetical protein